MLVIALAGAVGRVSTSVGGVKAWTVNRGTLTGPEMAGSAA